MVTVYVLSYEVPHEFGYPFGVYSTPEKAEAARAKFAEGYVVEGVNIRGEAFSYVQKRDPEDVKVRAIEVDAEPDR